MIPRTLVPQNVLPPPLEGSEPKRTRASTALDSRTLVPQSLPNVPLNGKSQIPDYIRLDVLGEPTLVPRHLPPVALETQSALPKHLPLEVLNSRIVVPGDAKPESIEAPKPASAGRLPEVLDPDIFNTGEVHLMARPVETRAHAWRGQAGLSTTLFHALLVALVLLQPQLFPYRPPSEADIEAAHRLLGRVYLPPSARTTPRASTPVPSTSPRIQVDPRVLKQLLPPAEEPAPTAKLAEPPKLQRDLPVAPVPQTANPAPPTPNRFESAQNPKLVQPRTPMGAPQLSLPRASAGRLLEDSIRSAAQNRGGNSGGFGGPGSGPGAAGGGGGQGMGGGFEVLTPTEGVDFSGYFDRMVARVKYNWLAVIPESARMGEKGRVVLEFSILKDGSIPASEPVLLSTSGREPLDRAALSSIHSSNPFEPLPSAFSGPLIRLRFTFLYNIPLETAR